MRNILAFNSYISGISHMHTFIKGMSHELCGMDKTQATMTSTKYLIYKRRITKFYNTNKGQRETQRKKPGAECSMEGSERKSIPKP